MGDDFRFRGPATEVETEHLIRPLGRCVSNPEADQQAGNQGRIPLEAYPVASLTQQMPAAQDTFDPAEKSCYRPAVAIRQRDQLRVEVSPVRDQAHNVWGPVLPCCARRHLDEAERLRQQARMMGCPQAAQEHITHHTGLHGGRREDALLLDLVSDVVLHATEDVAWQVVQLLQ